MTTEYRPPCNIEAEQAVLGSMLIEMPAIEKALDLLKSTDLYRAAHVVIFNAIVDLHGAGTPVDLISMQSELIRIGQLENVGGMRYLTSLFECTPTAANIAHYAARVLECSYRRKLHDIATKATKASQDMTRDVRTTIGQLQDALVRMERVKPGDDMHSIGAIVRAQYDQSEANSLNPLASIGIPTGLDAFDYMTGGLERKDFLLVAARPSIGKSALVFSWADHIAFESKKRVVMFSMDMTKEQVGMRMISMRSKIDARRLKLGRLDQSQWDRYSEVAQEFQDAPIEICDGLLSVPEMRSRCRQEARKGDIGIIVVDYIQMLHAEGNANRALTLGRIAEDLKNIGKEFNAPMIALSQLSRGIDNREDKRPLLGDLRESGGLEAAADVVVGLYREEYYKPKQEFSGDPSDKPVSTQEAELIVLKAKNGPTGTVKVGFTENFARFRNLDEDGAGTGDLELFPRGYRMAANDGPTGF